MRQRLQLAQAALAATASAASLSTTTRVRLKPRGSGHNRASSIAIPESLSLSSSYASSSQVTLADLERWEKLASEQGSPARSKALKTRVRAKERQPLLFLYPPSCLQAGGQKSPSGAFSPSTPSVAVRSASTSSKRHNSALAAARAISAEPEPEHHHESTSGSSWSPPFVERRRGRPLGLAGVSDGRRDDVPMLQPLAKREWKRLEEVEQGGEAAEALHERSAAHATTTTFDAPHEHLGMRASWIEELLEAGDIQEAALQLRTLIHDAIGASWYRKGLRRPTGKALDAAFIGATAKQFERIFQSDIILDSSSRVEPLSTCFGATLEELWRKGVKARTFDSPHAFSDYAAHLISSRQVHMAAEVVMWQLTELYTEGEEATTREEDSIRIWANFAALKSQLQEDASKQDLEHQRAYGALGDLLSLGNLPATQFIPHLGWLLASLNRLLKAGNLKKGLRQRIVARLHAFAERQASAPIPLDKHIFTTLLDAVLQHSRDVPLALKLIEAYIPGRIQPDETIRNVIFQFAGQQRDKSLMLGALHQLACDEGSGGPDPAQLFERHFEQALTADDPYKLAMLLRWAAHEHPWPAQWIADRRRAALERTFSLLWPQLGEGAESGFFSSARPQGASRCSRHVRVLTAALNMADKLGQPAVARALWKTLMWETTTVEGTCAPIEAATMRMKMLSKEALKARRVHQARFKEQQRPLPTWVLSEACTTHAQLAEHWRTHAMEPDLGYFHALLRVFTHTFGEPRPSNPLSADQRATLEAVLFTAEERGFSLHPQQRATASKLLAV